MMTWHGYFINALWFRRTNAIEQIQQFLFAHAVQVQRGARKALKKIPAICEPEGTAKKIQYSGKNMKIDTNLA